MRTSEQQIHLKVSIYGINVLITTTHKNIINYIDSNLFSFRANNDVDEYDLIIDITPIANPYKKFSETQGMPYYGSELYLKDNKVIHRTNTIYINAEVSGETLNVYVKKRLKWRQFLRKIVRVKSNDNALQELYRLGVEYPILAILNNKNSLSAIHASGVINADNDAILFFGLNGAGKSTLLEDMIKRGYQAIGENFVLLKEGKAYSFPGVKKLSKIPDYEKHKIVGRAYGKFLVKEDYSIHLGGYPVKRVNVVSRTDGETRIIRIDKQKALWFLNTMGDYLKEYENYHYTAFIGSDKASVTNRNYDKLTDEASFYIVEKNIKDRVDDSELL